MEQPFSPRATDPTPGGKPVGLARSTALADRAKSADILSLHRGIADPPRDYPARPIDLYKSLEQPRRGLLDRCADFFSSDRGFGFALGFYSGAMFTVAAALLLDFAK